MRESTIRQPDLIHGIPYWRRSLQDYVLDNILGHKLPERGSIRVMDLGCGLSHTLAKLSRLPPSGSEAVGIDGNSGVVKKAEALVKRTSGGSTIRVRCIDAERTPFRNGYFDLITAGLSLSVFERPGNVASEVARILKPGGKLIAAEVNKRSILGRVGELYDAM